MYVCVYVVNAQTSEVLAEDRGRRVGVEDLHFKFVFFFFREYHSLTVNSSVNESICERGFVPMEYMFI